MKLLTARSAILAAERQLEQSKHESRASIEHIRLAIRSQLARPMSLLVATGLGALLGVWFARRNKARVAPASTATTSARLPDVISKFLIRGGMQHLADFWTRLRTPAPQHSDAENSAN